MVRVCVGGGGNQRGNMLRARGLAARYIVIHTAGERHGDGQGESREQAHGIQGFLDSLEIWWVAVESVNRKVDDWNFAEQLPALCAFEQAVAQLLLRLHGELVFQHNPELLELGRVLDLLVHENLQHRLAVIPHCCFDPLLQLWVDPELAHLLMHSDRQLVLQYAPILLELLHGFDLLLLKDLRHIRLMSPAPDPRRQKRVHVGWPVGGRTSAIAGKS